jgi:hypothetical protein
VRPLSVAIHPGPDKDAFGAKAARRHAGHGRMDAIASGFIAGGADDAPLRGRAANDHRNAGVNPRSVLNLFRRQGTKDGCGAGSSPELVWRTDGAATRVPDSLAGTRVSPAHGVAYEFSS